MIAAVLLVALATASSTITVEYDPFDDKTTVLCAVEDLGVDAPEVRGGMTIYAECPGDSLCRPNVLILGLHRIGLSAELSKRSELIFLIDGERTRLLPFNYAADVEGAVIHEVCRFMVAPGTLRYLLASDGRARIGDMVFALARPETRAVLDAWVDFLDQRMLSIPIEEQADEPRPLLPRTIAIIDSIVRADSMKAVGSGKKRKH